jgi:hypothetical protein
MLRCDYAPYVDGMLNPPQNFLLADKSSFHIGVRVNRTRMTLIERIDADLFWLYPR